MSTVMRRGGGADAARVLAGCGGMRARCRAAWRCPAGAGTSTNTLAQPSRATVRRGPPRSGKTRCGRPRPHSTVAETLAAAVPPESARASHGGCQRRSGVSGAVTGDYSSGCAWSGDQITSPSRRSLCCPAAKDPRSTWMPDFSQTTICV